ncbi:alkaline phosphatase [Pedobacter yulinensis]|uniref:alkaline phosphatase n=1 Tax=Pedobacter yulinensis TaxID=2126353 RepID=UPI0026B2183D
MPYALDRANDKDLLGQTPSLAEMTGKAIELLNKNPQGFALQVEGGKVDWAAHANDAGALIYDQIAFDEAIRTAVDFAEKDGETLVVITTDHGNANPGLFYGSKADDHFDRIQTFRHTNEWILREVNNSTTAPALIDKIEFAQGYAITSEESKQVLAHYRSLGGESLYNPRNLPYKELAQIQARYTAVGWGSMDHSADYVELAMLGPGSELLPCFVKNFQLHNLMLDAAGLSR